MPPPRPRPKDRKATIVDAAAELFAARGFAAVGIDDIGAHVGVTGPAIYRHYAGKDAVLVAVLERTARALAAIADEPRPPGTAEIEHLVRGFVRIVLDQPSLMATYLRERGRLSTDAAAPLLAPERRIRRTWLAAMRAQQPDLDDVRAVVRRQAIVGSLAAGARNHRDVPRPRLDDVLAASAVGVVTAPIVPAVAGAPARAREASGEHELASKRDEILRGALALFRARGVSGVGVDEIGAAAGISGPTLYHYYDSKAAIVLDAYERAGESVMAGIEDALRGAHSADDALDRLIASYVSVAADNVDLIVVTSREGDALPVADKPRLARRRRVVRDGWTAAVRGVRPDLSDAEARLLVRCLFPLVNHAVEAAEGHPGLEREVVALASGHLRHK